MRKFIMRNSNLCRSATLLIVVIFLLMCSVCVSGNEYNDDMLRELFAQSLTANETEIEGIHYNLGQAFLADPQHFVHLLCEESEEIQNRVVDLVIHEFYYFWGEPHPAFPEAVYSVSLSEVNNEAAEMIMARFITAAEELWGIVNPKTGDPISMAVWGLIVCVGYGLLLVAKKRD